MTQATSFLTAVRAFEAAARHESFAKAATELGVSHTVVSRHIRNLEQWLETALFVRSGNRVALTADARRVAPTITAAFLAINDSFATVCGAPRVRPIRVIAEPAFATRWLRRHAHDFRAEFPGFEIDLKTASSPPRIRDGTADAIVHFETRLEARGAVSHRLFPIDAYPAGAPAMLKKYPDNNRAGGIEALPLIHDHGFDIWRDWFSQHLPRSAAWRNGRVYSDLSLAIDAAVDGEGVILADDILCAKEIQTGALVRLDGRILRCVWYCVVFDESAVSEPAVSAFRSWLLEQRF